MTERLQGDYHPLAPLTELERPLPPAFIRDSVLGLLRLAPKFTGMRLGHVVSGLCPGK